MLKYQSLCLLDSIWLFLVHYYARQAYLLERKYILQDFRAKKGQCNVWFFTLSHFLKTEYQYIVYLVSEKKSA